MKTRLSFSSAALALVSILFGGGLLDNSVRAGSVGLDAAGFEPLDVVPGFQLISNPFISPNNQVGTLLKNVPAGSVLLKWEANPPAANIPQPQSSSISNWLSQFPGGGPATSDLAVQIQYTNGNVVLRWNGTLQTATNVTGPFVDAGQTAQPLSVKPTEPRRFWRSTGQGSSTNAAGLSLSRFHANVFQNAQWSEPTMTLIPGDAAVLYNPTTNRVEVTFSGTVLEGTSTNQVPAGLSFVASLIPVDGGLTTKLSFQPNTNDQVILWNGASFQVFTFQADKTWSPAEPAIPLLGAFFVRAAQPIVWQQTVNTQ